MLGTLRASLGPVKTSEDSTVGSLLLRFVHAHSSVEALRNLALQPAPALSTAAFGLSCSLNNSQFAYTHFSSQYTVTKSASSTIIVYVLRSPADFGPATFSENAEESIVAKYSDRRVRMSEWAYMTRLRTKVDGTEEVVDAEDEVRRL